MISERLDLIVFEYLEKKNNNKTASFEFEDTNETNRNERASERTYERVNTLNVA